MIVVTSACSRPDVKQQAQERLRADVGRVRVVVAEVLGAGGGTRALLQAAVSDAVGSSGLVTEVTPTAGVVRSVQLVLTVRAERGGGLDYSSWTSRACVAFTVASDALSTMDVDCPAGLEPDPGPVDEVLRVAA